MECEDGGTEIAHYDVCLRRSPICYGWDDAKDLDRGGTFADLPWMRVALDFLGARPVESRGMLKSAADASAHIAIFEITRLEINKHRCARIAENNTR